MPTDDPKSGASEEPLVSHETKTVYELYRSAYLDGESDKKLRFIRRSDHVQVLDLTTLRKTVQLEIRIDPKLSPDFLPVGLLAKGSYLGGFRISDRDGRKLTSPPRTEADDFAKEVLEGLRTKAEADSESFRVQQNPSNEDLCRRLVDCYASSEREDYCESCKDHYLDVDVTKEVTAIAKIRRRYYGCRSLAVLAGRIPTLEPSTDSCRNLLRALFDFSDSTILLCEYPRTDNSHLTMSYTYEEEMDEWWCATVQAARARSRSRSDGGIRTSLNSWEWPWKIRNALSKKRRDIAGRGPLKDEINKISSSRRWWQGLRDSIVGFKTWSIYWEAPSLADYGSYHCDIEVPEGLSIRRAVVATWMKDQEAKFWQPTEIGSRTHLAVSPWRQSRADEPQTLKKGDHSGGTANAKGRTDLARGAHAVTLVEIVATDSATWLVGGMLGLLSGSLLVAFSYEWLGLAWPFGLDAPLDIKDRIDSVVALLIIAPTIIGAFVGIRALNEIGSRLMGGVIWRVGLVALFSATSAILITLFAGSEPSEPWVSQAVAPLGLLCLFLGLLMLIGASLSKNASNNALRDLSLDESNHRLGDFPIPNAYVRSGEGERYVPSLWQEQPEWLLPTPGDADCPDDTKDEMLYRCAAEITLWL